MKNILMTGASGFIGGRLCSELLTQNLSVRQLGRSEKECEATFFKWNMDEPLDVGMMIGVDTVFHVAGKAHALSETEQGDSEYFRINTEATKRLLELASEAGVKTFVYFSSVKAVGDVDGVMGESVNVEADTPYGRSKRAAEELVLNGDYVPCPVVIRPVMVYGATLKGNLPKMIQAIATGRFPPLFEVNNQRTMVHVDDVVQAAMLAAEAPSAAGQVYIVTGPEICSTRQLYEWICGALGKPIPNWWVPMPVLILLGRVGDVIGFVRGRRFMFDSDTLDKLVGSACYSSKKIQDDLGYKPHRTLEEGLPKIVNWMRKQGAL